MFMKINSLIALQSVAAILFISEQNAIAQVSEPITKVIEEFEAGSPVNKIFYGKKASITDNPWQVALLYSKIKNTFKAQFCAGSVVSDRWIVTAAHCVDGNTKASDVNVLHGVDTLSSIGDGNGRVEVQNIYIHRRYNMAKRFDSDIALLELAAAVSAKPIDMARFDSEGAPSGPGIKAKVAGWGRTERGAIRSDELREGLMPILSHDDCGDVNVWGDRFTSNMLCAGDPLNPDVSALGCMGDSGGPLSVENTLIGIVSFGKANCKAPTVFTRVSRYAKDILECLRDRRICAQDWK